MKRQAIKRETDLQIISGWIADGARVLDLGCGRGIFLQYLQQTKGVYGVGVDNKLEKIKSCVKRGVPAYQGDIFEMLAIYPDNYFDWVVCSRTLQDLAQPNRVFAEALRVGKRLAVGFVNHGYWLNRWHMLIHGGRVVNEVFPDAWYHSQPTNPVSLRDFEAFCLANNYRIRRCAYLKGDWRNRCRFMPQWFAGYALYELSQS